VLDVLPPTPPKDKPLTRQPNGYIAARTLGKRASIQGYGRCPEQPVRAPIRTRVITLGKKA